MKHLDNITIRELSAEERNRSWSAISSRLSSTPVVSPWFRNTRALSLVVACLVVVTTLGVADNARPGDALFAIDTGTEHVIEYVYPARRVNHAAERLTEFESAVSATPRQETVVAETAMLKSAPMAADMAMMSGSANDTQQLDPYTEAVIEQTRNELTNLLLDALNTNDQKTIDGILTIIAAFESRTQELRSQ